MGIVHVVLSDSQGNKVAYSKEYDVLASQDMLIGAYNGIPLSEDPTNKFYGYCGKLPQIQSYYWQTMQTISEAQRNYVLGAARLGIAGLHTYTTKGEAGLIQKVADRTDTDRVVQYLQQCEFLAKAVPDVKQFIAFEHESDVTTKLKWLGLTGSQSDMAMLARAQNTFFTLASKHAPNCIPGLWIGGSNKTRIDYLLSGIKAANVQFLSWDPYTWRWTPYETARNAWQDVSTWLDGNPHYVRLGSPQKAISEFGIDVREHGDDASAKYMTGLREAASHFGMAFVVHFNRNVKVEGGTNYFRIDGGDTQKTVAAFRANL